VEMAAQAARLVTRHHSLRAVPTRGQIRLHARETADNSACMLIVARGLLAGVCLVMAASVWAATEPAKPESGQAAPPAPVVRYADDKLSVEAKGADPAVVLQAIARASGAELVGAPRGGQPLT